MDLQNALKNMDMQKYLHTIATSEERQKKIDSILTPSRVRDIFKLYRNILEKKTQLIRIMTILIILRIFNNNT